MVSPVCMVASMMSVLLLCDGVHMSMSVKNRIWK